MIKTNAATALTLTINQPILIIFTPDAPRNSWWRDRKGILSLRMNSLIDWNSDHLLSNEPNKVKPSEMSKEYFIQALRADWEIYLAYCHETNRRWFEPDFRRDWEYPEGRVIIPVLASKFVLS
jgi:hypothetical protein